MVMALAIFRSGAGNRQTGQPRQRFHRFGKAQVIVAHHKPDHVAMGTATEAVKKSFLIVDREAWAFFVMKRTRGRKFPTATHQPQPTADHLGKRQAGAEFFEEGGRNRHSIAPPPIPLSPRIATVARAVFRSKPASPEDRPWQSPSARHSEPEVQPSPCPYL